MRISKFGLREATDCSLALRKIGRDCRSMEEAGNRIVKFFFDSFTDETGLTSDFALVRLFATRAFGKLDTGLKAFARRCFSNKTISNATKCLTLLATTGDAENLKSRENSKGHKAIPLISEDVVNKLPMIRNLLNQLGLDVKTVLSADPGLIRDLAEKTYNIFLVQDAPGSQYIPAQNDFVVPFHIKSVLGFGGVLPDGELFTVIIFSKAIITEDVAALFRTIALSTKISLLPFMGKVFA